MDFFDSFDDLFPKGALDGVLSDRRNGEETAEDERRIWSVGELLLHVNTVLDLEFGRLWIEGEIGQVSIPSSGHCYFSLKDERGCLVRTVCFKSDMIRNGRFIEEGAKVLCLGRLNVYQARGDLQVIVEHVEPWGEGRLRIEFERLKKRLEEEGLFDEEHKSPVPPWPGRIFVITSPTGAALRDFVKTASCKFPPARIVLVPSKVQGADAHRELINALDMAETCAGEGDVIVITRGGGSIEDLWAFNNEELARRIFRCSVPVVSAVGHEVDFTICDFVADRRAATPTAAAELVCPARSEMLEMLERRVGRMVSALQNRLLRAFHRLEILVSRVRHPSMRIIEQRLRLDELHSRAVSSVTGALSRKYSTLSGLHRTLLMLNPESRVTRGRNRLQGLEYRMVGLAQAKIHSARERLLALVAAAEMANPKACFKRGFSMVFDCETGSIVTDASAVRQGQQLEIVLLRGRLECMVKAKKEGGAH